jgi:hypothetical protein
MTNEEKHKAEILHNYLRDWFASVEDGQATEVDLQEYLYFNLTEKAKGHIYEVYENNI